MPGHTCYELSQDEQIQLQSCSRPVLTQLCRQTQFDPQTGFLHQTLQCCGNQAIREAQEHVKSALLELWNQIVEDPKPQVDNTALAKLQWYLQQSSGLCEGASCTE